MTTLSQESAQRIRDLVCEHLELEPEDITDTRLFVEDYGADSLSLIDLAASIEKEFSVDINQQDLTHMVNLLAVYEVTARSQAL
jgi:acyl carrier protein